MLQEAQKCTFKPEIVSKRSPSVNRNQDIQLHERLYEEAYRNGDQMKKARIEHEKNLKNECPFTPARKATKAKDTLLRRETSTQRAERLYSEWANRTRKLEHLRKQRDQIIEEKTTKAQNNLKEELAQKKIAVSAQSKLYETSSQDKE